MTLTKTENGYDLEIAGAVYKGLTLQEVIQIIEVKTGDNNA